MAVGGGSGGGGASGAVRAGAAFVELFTNDTKLVAGLKSAQRRVAAYGAVMQKVGGVMLGAGAAGLTAAGVAVGGFLSRAGELQALATKLGIPVERLSAFAHAAAMTGVSVEDLAGHFENLAERVYQFAANGGGEAADTFRKLNIDAAALARMAPDEQLIALADAMRGVTNETERLGMLSSMGGDQFQKLNDLFRQGPDAIRKYMVEAERLGIALTPAQAEKAAAANKELNRAWEVGKGLVGQLASAILPSADAVRSIGQVFTIAAQAAAEFIKNNRLLIVGGVAAAAALAGVGAVLVGVGGAFALASAAVSAIMTPGGAIVAGVAAGAVAFTGLAAAVGLFATQTETGRDAVNALFAPVRGLYEYAAPAFERLGNLFSSTYEGMTAAMASGRFELAGKVAMAGLNAVWTEALDKLQTGWTGFKEFWVDGWHDVVTEVSLAMVTMIEKIRGLLDQLGWETRYKLEAIARIGGVFTGTTKLIEPAIDLYNGTSFDGEGLKRNIRDQAAAEQADRNVSRANAALGTAIMAGFAGQVLQRLVDEAKGPAPNKGKGFEPPALPRLDKAVGAFIQGASPQQIFGGVRPQQLLLDENKKQTNRLDALIDVGKGMAGDVKDLARGLTFK